MQSNRNNSFEKITGISAFVCLIASAIASTAILFLYPFLQGIGFIFFKILFALMMICLLPYYVKRIAWIVKNHDAKLDSDQEPSLKKSFKKSFFAVPSITLSSFICILLYSINQNYLTIILTLTVGTIISCFCTTQI